MKLEDAFKNVEIVCHAFKGLSLADAEALKASLMVIKDALFPKPQETKEAELCQE
jgi:hypothetical protein